MRKINETYVFKAHSASMVDNLKSVVAIVGGGNENELVKPINDLLIEIRKKERIPIRSKGLNAVLNKQIIPLTNKELHGAVPLYLPFVTFRSKGKTQTYFNLIPYIRNFDSVGQVNMNRKTLMGMTVCAALCNDCAENPVKYSNNSKILQYASTIYSRTIIKTIDRVYGLSQNVVFEDQCRYLLAKFFIINGMQIADSERVSKLALSSINGTNPVIVQTIDSNIPEDMFESIGQFVMGLNKLFPRLQKLNVRNLYKEIIAQYKFTATLMVEHPPYLFMMVLSTLLNTNLINEFGFAPVLGNEGVKLYSELENLIGK